MSIKPSAYAGMPGSGGSSRYFLSLQMGADVRCMALRPATFYLAILLLGVACAGFATTSAYLFFRDDILQALISQHRESEHAYQVRIASLQTKLDRVSTRQLIDQETLENNIHDIANRQARLEARNATLATLVQMSGLTPAAGAGATAPHPQAATTNPLLAFPVPRPALPRGASSYANPSSAETVVTRPTPAPLGDVATPETEETAPARLPDGLRASAGDSFLSLTKNRSVPMAKRARLIAASVEKLELAQVASLQGIDAAAHQRVKLLDTTFSGLGLDAAGLKVPKSGATGGPFVPLADPADQSAFGVNLRRIQTTLDRAQHYGRVLPFVPLRKPLEGALEVTSPFGGRADPFYGRAAMHTGMDLRDDLGSPVQATAAGRVAFAGWNGGYGNMVEIDHGNGLATRYAHLSAITVKEGQTVSAGEICGRLGSTGRSTGPHLHYEVRVDDVAVDPSRFIKAGERPILAAMLASRPSKSASIR